MNWLFHRGSRHRRALTLWAAGVVSEEDHAVRAARRHLAGCAACRAWCREIEAVVKRGNATVERLPLAMPSAGFEASWTTAVLGSARAHPGEEPVRPAGREPESSMGAGNGMRYGWGVLAGAWVLILFFRFSAPDVHRPEVPSVTADWRLVMNLLGLSEGPASSESSPVKERQIGTDVDLQPAPRGPLGNLEPRGGWSQSGRQA
ncbi:MAG: hypothetical protein IT580_18175 [Verrucomicrobiales bacterium]|nr:hypothetical protein [Verrucomicrobiales bacterium]